MTNPDGTQPQPGGAGGGDWIGALINAGAGLYDSYQNRKASRQNTDKTIAAQKAESELAYQRSMSQWAMQNAYNTPQAQMDRYQEAGLNSQLIYGQGNSGNASSPQAYQPANMQYRYEAPQYGSAIQTILPTLMAVGTWMQNMKLSQVQIEKQGTETERTRQMIDYLLEANPKLLTGLDNRLSLFPYQRDAARFGAGRAYQSLAEMNQDYKVKYGEELWRELQFDAKLPSGAGYGGLKKLQYLQEESKSKLLDAKSSMTDLNITDPQALMQLVLSGVMGLAGQQIRLSTHKRPKTTTGTTETLRNGRTKTRYRTVE